VTWGENDAHEPPKVEEIDEGEEAADEQAKAVNEAAQKVFSAENVAYPGLGQSRLDLYQKALDKQKEEKDATKAAAAAAAAPKPESVLHNSLIDELE